MHSVQGVVPGVSWLKPGIRWNWMSVGMKIRRIHAQNLRRYFHQQIQQKCPAAEDKLFVHWKNIQTDDRFPRLKEGLQNLASICPFSAPTPRPARYKTGVHQNEDLVQ